MIIIKIGGGEKINIEGISKNIKALIEKGEKIIVVHGANVFRDELAEKIGVEKKVIKSLSGYDSVFSDEEMINLIMMSYSGFKNKRMVELCQKNKVNAIGLSGIDAGIISGERTKGIKTEMNGKLLVIRDFSGKPKNINKEFIEYLLNKKYVPILTIPILDECGFAVNSENDDIIALLQKELKAEKIVQLIEASGFLENPKDENSIIKKISKEELEKMEDKFSGRMKRKIYALRKLFERSEESPVVFISDGRTQNPVLDALNGRGTTIQ